MKNRVKALRRLINLTIVFWPASIKANFNIGQYIFGDMGLQKSGKMLIPSISISFLGAMKMLSQKQWLADKGRRFWSVWAPSLKKKMPLLTKINWFQPCLKINWSRLVNRPVRDISHSKVTGSRPAPGKRFEQLFQGLKTLAQHGFKPMIVRSLDLSPYLYTIWNCTYRHRRRHIKWNFESLCMSTVLTFYKDLFHHLWDNFFYNLLVYAATALEIVFHLHHQCVCCDSNTGLYAWPKFSWHFHVC